MSLDLLDAALMVPVRTTTPRAPAHGLLLADSEFGDFAVPKGSGDEAVVADMARCMADSAPFGASPMR